VALGSIDSASESDARGTSLGKKDQTLSFPKIQGWGAEIVSLLRAVASLSWNCIRTPVTLSQIFPINILHWTRIGASSRVIVGFFRVGKLPVLTGLASYVLRLSTTSWSSEEACKEQQASSRFVNVNKGGRGVRKTGCGQFTNCS
jgi:hypothetical protein